VLRFECPRCQTVFTRDRGEDDAFVECPSCGALAMSAGEATGADSNALARTLSSTHDISGLNPAVLAQRAADDSDDASVRTERPSLETSPHGDSVDDSGDGEGVGGGIFAGLLGPDGPGGDIDDGSGLSLGRAAPTPSALPAVARAPVGPSNRHESLDLGLGDELGDFELPSTAPANKALSPAQKSPRPNRRGDADRPRPAPPPPPPEVSASLSDDAMGALEAAFDSMAARPTEEKRDGLTDDERRFLENVAGAGPPPPAPRGAANKPPPRPPERPGVPRAAPPPRKKRPPPTALTLSAEAKAAAFIQLKRAAPPSPTPSLARSDSAQQLSTDPEVTAPGHDAAPPRPPATPNRPKPAAADAVVDSAPKRVVRERPTLMGGLPKLALAAAVVVGLIGGGAVGAATAPEGAKRNDARARAEFALADGNRYYDAARFDDAVGRYKNAINNDRTYAPAHRAKGAALAKLAQLSQQAQQVAQAQSQWDEAAAAYREYLVLEPSAIDAADIKEALSRRGLSPVAGGLGTGAPPAGDGAPKDTTAPAVPATNGGASG
jgi:hypothetical protein